MVESRRISYEQMEWQTPALSLTAQAFLLTIALDPGVRPAGRFIASLLGLAVAVAVLQIFLKHRYHEELCSHWVDRKLGEDAREGIRPEALIEFAYPDGGKEPLTRSAKRLEAVLVNQPAFRVWRIALWAFLLADACILILTLLEVAGGPSVLG